MKTTTNRDLSISEVARACKVSVSLAKRWIDAGLLPGYTVPMSKHRRVRATELRAFQERYGLAITVPANGDDTTQRERSA